MSWDMLDPQVLLHLREALEGQPDWLEVRMRLQRLAPEGREGAYRPFVFAFGYFLVERSQADRRERAGGPFGAAHRADGWRFPPAVADVEEADVQAWVDAVEALEDPVSSARLHDLLWERRARPRPDLDARAAADAYLELVELGGWHVMERTRCLTRAIELAHAVNDVDRLRRAVERCVRFVGDVVASSDRGPGAAVVVLRALVDLPPKHRPAELQGLLAAVTERFGDDPHLFDSVAELGARTADPGGQEELRRAQVQRWREAAEQGDAILRVIRLEQALEVARTHGLADEADKIRRELQDIAPDDLPLETISAPLELPAEEVKAYIASFAEQEDWREALRHFGSEDPPGGTSQAMEDDLDREREEFALLHVFTKTVMGHGTAASLFRAGDEESRRRLDRAERRAMYARMWSPLAADILRAVLQRHGRPGHDELADFFATELIGAERGERIARALELFGTASPTSRPIYWCRGWSRWFARWLGAWS
jgi:hypothetical protein